MSGKANEMSAKTQELGEVEAIGKHCDLPECHLLDFLPFKCESCGGTYCLDHRTETAHKCAHEGRWAAARREKNTSSSSSSSSSTSAVPARPKIRSLLQTDCAHPKCKTIINTPRDPAVNCTTCRKQYCLSHRLQDQHDCDKVRPPPPTVATANEKAKAALSRFKAWTSSKSDKVIQSARPGASQIAELNKLKRAAKGDDKVPAEKRVYVHVEAEARTTTSKLPRGEFYYSKEWTVGRVLDKAAQSLQVANLNNKADDDEKKLRVFHVEAGRVLSFGEKFGDAVANGNTIVLLRGLQMPDLME
ncbi:hypothetical protein L873DRAFT_1826332 [Choiromyces venosus 120613-1]|uniref:AN1-type domain-containing protein n=1 Tax=Choiromyces venosus 120613-1 TaxID=1336337 RepID=A0A3N4K4D7_9PEZI|nr:hypothetical protein L873DRAFT_1826332 [Choiromyces venosus 120613-1]